MVTAVITNRKFSIFPDTYLRFTMSASVSHVRAQAKPASRGFWGRYGSLVAVFLCGCTATLLLLRKQPELLSATLYNPFATMEDPFESYSEFSVEISHDNSETARISNSNTKISDQVTTSSLALAKNPVITDPLSSPKVSRAVMMKQPVLGEIPVNGAKPLFGKQHEGGDAIFALACKYPKLFYERFVGSLRKSGFKGDIVLAVSPVDKMKPGVADYVKQKGVVAYGFEVDCKGKDNCKLMDEFLGYPDPRPYRTFANIRYALYEYWIDTFFQADPFGLLPPLKQRKPVYDLRLFAENWKVKKLGTCRYNGWWIRKCFSKEAIIPIYDKAVICSGSTMGSYDAVAYYTSVMLRSMDTIQCWRKGIESDQGYQNYLFYNGFFDAPDGSVNATLFHQGSGVVNTIGAMNGFKVPKDQKGPLDTFWKIRDKDGYVLNTDGSRSACVHQWDRFYDELQPFIDANTFDNDGLWNECQ